ncbi:hypothetical protein [Chondromyces crocatus]|uniref:Prolow-density lipoprotein receptor-related protein 1-like beta-propeller domain-containing protein n=1 Tax=Chondromyces crocatus TaxID=52 RepID=A0A0K1ERR1_CHOCO|nr:hypothetical protein [Chondromyces crocatus]AKT43347.1 uncharacterized protein CMC5_075790 [Chondromyces crocatus]
MTSLVRYGSIFALVALGAACGGDDDGNPLFPTGTGGSNTGGAGGMGGAGGAGGAGGEGGEAGCPDGFEDCDGDPTNGCEVEFASDLANCGACFSVCLGASATCSGGECSGVTELAGLQGEPNHLAVDGTNLYWTSVTDVNLGEVRQMPKQGGAVLNLGVDQPLPGAIAVNATSVFWANLNSPVINRATIGIPDAGLFAQDAGALWGIAADAEAVYWTRDDGELANSGIVRAPLNGGAHTLIVPGSETPYAIAIDSTSVYWTDRSAGQVLKAPLTGGTPEILAETQPQPYSIAVDAAHVYWTNRACSPGGGQAVDCVMRVRKDGMDQPVSLADGQSVPYSIAVDGQHVYWTDAGLQRVLRTPVEGGAIETLASTQAGLVHMVIDDTHVYWANEGDGGSIRKLRK